MRLTFVFGRDGLEVVHEGHIHSHSHLHSSPTHTHTDSPALPQTHDTFRLVFSVALRWALLPRDRLLAAFWVTCCSADMSAPDCPRRDEETHFGGEMLPGSHTHYTRRRQTDRQTDRGRARCCVGRVQRGAMSLSSARQGDAQRTTHPALSSFALPFVVKGRVTRKGQVTSNNSECFAEISS